VVILAYKIICAAKWNYDLKLAGDGLNNLGRKTDMDI